MSKIESFSNDQGISQEILINNVGNQVIKWLKKNITSLNNKKFLILIGKGNNGSDGLTIAKKLLPIVKNVFVAAPIGRSEDNYIKNFISAGGEVYGIKKNINIKAFEEALNTTDIVIDCIFGTGINKSINHPLDIFFNMVNESKKPVIALDIPSGINPNTGENDKNSLSSNIACTVLKVQEKKTQKGSSYAIVKLSDLSGVFELFIFSDIFDLNRDKLIEGNSLMITLIKNYTDEAKSQKRINVKKIITLKEILNSTFDKIKLKINSLDELSKIKDLSKTDGKTQITFVITDDDTDYTFSLNDKRYLDNNLINKLKIRENILLD